MTIELATDTGGRFFARPFSANPIRDEVFGAQSGATLRDVYAGLAMLGLLAGRAATGVADPRTVAAFAFAQADEMIARRVVEG